MDGKGTRDATDGIEQCQWSPRTGKFYLNIPEVDGDGNNTKPGMVLVIDPVTREIEQKWTIPLAVCTGPQGMAIGPTNQILLGCARNNKTLVGTGSVIIDEDPTLRTPKILHMLTVFGAMTKSGSMQATISTFLRGEPSKTLRRRPQRAHRPDGKAADSPNSFSGSHSVAADPVQNQVYVPVNNGTACDSIGSASNYCIAVFTATGTDDPSICVGQGAPVISVDDEGTGEPVLLKVVCPPKGNK